MFFRVALILILTHQASSQEIQPIVIDRSGNPVNGGTAQISEDGRTIIFSSDSNNVIDGDTNSINRSTRQGPASDVFYFDRETNVYNRISLTHDGKQIEDGNSILLSVSNDFQKVLFYSEGQSQFPTDIEHYGNFDPDIYLYDVISKSVRWVSVTPEGSEGDGQTSNAILSGNGNSILLTTGSTNFLPTNIPYDSQLQLLLFDLVTDERELAVPSIDGIKPANNFLDWAMSNDGKDIAFISRATNLTEDGVGGFFLRDMETKITELISRTPTGEPIEFEFLFEAESIDISDDGRYIFFISHSNQHVEDDPHPGEHIGRDGFIYDRITKQTKVIPLGEYSSPDREEGAIRGLISPNGRYVVFTTPQSEMFLYDQFAGSVELLFSKEMNHPLIPDPNIEIRDITSDGKYILFTNAVVDSSGRYLQSNILYLMTRDITTSHIEDWELLK